MADFSKKLDEALDELTNGRYVVINEAVEPQFAVPFSNRDQALQLYRQLLLKYIPGFYNYKPGTQEYEDLKTADENTEFAEILLCMEGRLGVWTSFVTPDRNSICGPLPITVDYLGAGDPILYLTAKKPDGKPVPATLSVSKNYTHPFYQQWLDAHPNR